MYQAEMCEASIKPPDRKAWETRTITARGNESVICHVCGKKVAVRRDLSSDHSPVVGPHATLFNEDSLRAAIVSVWGEHGAHIVVYDELMRRAKDYKPKADRYQIIGPAKDHHD